ncbi:MAG: hypothetical protein H3C31_05360 [Brumimicrobium sp.]|nr:hypothetical protein [Brumimicrobium sp.]MCO5268312.1 hypothetical protein [Brumimicrobium sp.]
MRTKTSIRALILLMSDSDELVRIHAKETLCEYGCSILPDIEQLEEEAILHPEYHENLVEVLNHLRLGKLKFELQQWLNSRTKDLKEAVYLIDTYQFPEFSKEDFDDKISSLQHRCWLRINHRQTSFERVKILNELFFEEFDFYCIERLPYTPFDIYVNSVMDTKEGSSFSLGLIYSILAQSMDIPIYGVVSTNNRTPFVLAYMDKNHSLSFLNWEINNNGVLFYISVGREGAIIEPSRLVDIYEAGGLPTDKAQFEPSSNTTLIKRYLLEIHRSYSNQPHFRYKLKDIEELLDLF